MTAKERTATMVRLLALGALAVVVIALWAIPGVLFPDPGPNDAIWLSSVGPLVYLLTLVAAALSLVAASRLGWGVDGPFALGVFLLGLVAVFVGGIAAFGNFQNDRFAPLFLAPLLALPVGVLIVAVCTARRPRAERLVRGGALGAVAAGAVAAWLLLRGAADWLQAPYGFDVFLLIALAAAATLYVAEVSGRSSGTARPPAEGHA